MDRLVAKRRVHSICVWALLIVFQTTSAWAQPEQWISYQGGEGPGSGKKIVLVSGDEEYRSEEALPMLAKILSTHHGFDCTVLFPIDRESGIVNPYESGNIPGLEQLDSADLMVIFTKFQELSKLTPKITEYKTPSLILRSTCSIPLLLSHCIVTV